MDDRELLPLDYARKDRSDWIVTPWWLWLLLAAAISLLCSIIM
jgi:hypothetical protein